MLTGVFLSAAFPPWNHGLFALFAVSPLLYAILRAKGRIAFALGYLPGVVLAGSFFHPLVEISNFPFAAFVVIALVCGLFFGIFSFLFKHITQSTNWPLVVVAPALWVSIEYLRSNLLFLSNPGYQIGYALHEHIHIIQIASLTSVYGVSFLIILVNTMIVEMSLALSQKRKNGGQRPGRSLSSGFIIGTGPTLAVFLVVLGYGFNQLNQGIQADSDSVKIALIQTNLTSEERDQPELTGTIMDRYRSLTITATADNPDLIVWPESSTPTHLTSDPIIYDEVVNIVREAGTPFVLGSSARDKSSKRKTPGMKVNNRAYLIDSGGKIVASYKKIHLVPFWEYLPLEGVFEWPGWLVPGHGNTLPGDEATIFEVDGHRFGVVICWEVLFPDFYRRFTRQRPEMMLNLSNESVFGWTSAPYKVQAMAVFRAVESRTPLLRSGLTGMTSYIDRFGREIARITDAEENDLMVEGFLTVDVPVSHETTFYTRYGDVFAFLCVGWTLLMLMHAWALKVRKRDRKGPPPGDGSREE